LQTASILAAWLELQKLKEPLSIGEKRQAARCKN
jgi:hypothetical protein